MWLQADRCRCVANRIPPRDGHHVGEAAWNVGDPVGPVPSPGDDRTVLLQGEAVVATGRDRGDVRETGRNVRLAAAVVPPRDDGTVVHEREAVAPSGGDGCDVR